ncbi:MAG: hypothetical protein ACI8ZM_002002 [Crocinitomix sp.]|jgi:hypothetical protein
MIIEIGDKLVSDEIFEKEFVCNLGACKGACCVEGDDGAPLTMEEVTLLEDNIDAIKPYMTPEGLDVVERKGVFYMDPYNEPVTSLVKGAECAFVFRDTEGITKCSVEQAYRDEKSEFNKPMSCHLYPIRAKKFRTFTSLNYDRWSICKDACTLGEELGVPVYKFLKEPLIRAYGANFYTELEKAAAELEEKKKN